MLLNTYCKLERRSLALLGNHMLEPVGVVRSVLFGWLGVALKDLDMVSYAKLIRIGSWRRS